jgi:Domain of unknown function (DUF4157)
MYLRIMREAGATNPAPSRKPIVVPRRSPGVLQRCGSGRCLPGACDHSDESVLSRSAIGVGPEFVPPIVSEVLASPGRPLEPIVRMDMETSFRHDFSQVRVHTDAMAATSAQAVDALAYTVGNDIVFGSGRYDPHTTLGHRLLAHELTHVMQQGPTTSRPSSLRVGATNDALEQLADQAAAKPSAVSVASAMVPRQGDVVRRQQTRGPAATLDEQARAIIAAASDETVPAEKRAVQVVRSILNTYFPSDAALVEDIVFVEKTAELETPPVRPGPAAPTARSKIIVGKNFLSGTTAQGFASRVLQVDHELEHIRQYRRGMGGAADKPLREFLAHRREALEPTLPGTGSVPHSNRVEHIDEALRNYCLFTTELQARFESERDELVNARARHMATGRVSDKLPKQPPACSVR